MLENRALAAKSQGHTKEALDYMTRYSSLMNQLNDAANKSAAQEYAARYHEQEQQFALERERAEARRTRMLVVALVIIVALFVVFLGLLLMDVAVIRRKNRVLASQISENITHQKAEIQAQKNDSNPDLASMSEAQLFEYLRYVIVTEELYTDSRLDRQHLMDRFHLSKEKIGAAFSHGSPYQSLAAFLNVVRLKRAAKLLSSSPEMSIADVAAACGFSSGSLFARNFKQYFALTPTEFRRNPEGTDRS
jgi:AraC-like DNA-binding protein